MKGRSYKAVRKIILPIFAFIFIFIIAGMANATSWNSSLNNGLISFYGFQETSGNLIDQISSQNGINTNVLQGQAGGILGTAYFYNGYTTGVAQTNISASTFLNEISNNFTIEMWVKLNNTKPGNTQIIGGFQNATGPRYTGVLGQYNNNPSDYFFSVGTNNSQQFVTTPNNTAETGWEMLTGVYNNTAISIYVNGTYEGYTALSGNVSSNVWGQLLLGSDIQSSTGKNYNGSIGQMAIWNRSMGQTEINQLYNSGSGITYSNIVNLLYPTNNIVTSNQSFSANSYPQQGFSFVNATLNIWYQNGTLSYQSTNPVTGTAVNSTVWNANSLAPGNYSWNVQFCSVNGGTTSCSFALSNYTLMYGISGITQGYSSSILSGSTIFFQANFTADSSISLVKLIYNNTAYPASLSLNSGNYIASLNALAPTVSTTASVPFYWNFNFADGFGYNTSQLSQTISTLSIDNCAVNTVEILNFTMFDQDYQTLLNNTLSPTIQTVVTIYSPGTNNVIGYYNTTYQNGTGLVCFPSGILNSSTYAMSDTTKFFAVGYNPQYYNVQYAVLNNNTIPFNTPFYDSLSNETQAYQINFKDRYGNPITGAVANILRQYLPTNSYNNVEAPLTDNSGNALVHLISNTQSYIIELTQNGTVLSTWTQPSVTCNSATVACTITLNTLVPNIALPTPSQYDNNLEYTLIYNSTSTSTAMQLIYNTIDGTTQNITWIAIENDGYGNNTICDVSQFSSIGSMNCPLPTVYQNSSVINYIYLNGMLGAAPYKIYTGPATQNPFGGTGIVIAILLYTSLALLFISSPFGIIVGSVIGLILCVALDIVSAGSGGAVFGIVTWFVLAGIIIIFKMFGPGGGG